MSKSMTVELRKIRPIVEEIVEEKLIEILGDPDEGLNLKPEIRRRLDNAIKYKTKGIPADKVAEKLGLRW